MIPAGWSLLQTIHIAGLAADIMARCRLLMVVAALLSITGYSHSQLGMLRWRVTVRYEY